MGLWLTAAMVATLSSETNAATSACWRSASASAFRIFICSLSSFFLAMIASCCSFAAIFSAATASASSFAATAIASIASASSRIASAIASCAVPR